MASTFSDAAKHIMLDALKAEAKFVSLHSDYPATAGNEISGGGYARQPITWGTSSGGKTVATNQPVFSVASGTTIKAVGLFSAATAGTLYGSYSAKAETYANPGTYKIDTAEMNLNIVDS